MHLIDKRVGHGRHVGDRRRRGAHCHRRGAGRADEGRRSRGRGVSGRRHHRRRRDVREPEFCGAQDSCRSCSSARTTSTRCSRRLATRQPPRDHPRVGRGAIGCPRSRSTASTCWPCTTRARRGRARARRRRARRSSRRPSTGSARTAEPGDDSHTGYRDEAERDAWEAVDPVSICSSSS